MLSKLFYKEYAIIVNDDGILLKIKKIKLKENTFVWDGKTYNVIRDKAHRDTIQKWFGIITHYRYHYNVRNPNPFGYNKNSKNYEPLIETDLLNTLLEASVIKALNKPKFDLFATVKPYHIVIGLVLMVIGYYALNGGLV